MSAPHQQAMARVDGVQIREKASLLEAATAMLGQEVEMANKYTVFDPSGNTQLFYAVEQTDCCTRQVKQCLGDCAPWSVEILYTEGGRSDKAYHLERPFTCTCCCLNRPVVEVKDVPAGVTIGKVRDPCALCNLVFDVMDAKDETILQASGGCCQLGMWCPCPCGPCSEVNFDLTDKNGQEVGKLKKKLPGCCRWFFSPDVDNYHVDFPGVRDPDQKALLMALAIFMDFRYFSDNARDNGDQGAAQE